MRRRAAAGIAALALLAPAVVWAEQTPWKKETTTVLTAPPEGLRDHSFPGEFKPSFKTMKVTYKTAQKTFDGDKKLVTQTEGKEKWVLDAAEGRYRIEQDQVFSAGGAQDHRQILRIFDGKIYYTVVPAGNEATMTELPMQREMAWSGILPGPNGAKLGEEKVLGRSCDVYQVAAGKGWMWQGILLKWEAELGSATLFMEAVEVEENPAVDPALFQLPKDKPLRRLKLGFPAEKP